MATFLEGVGAIGVACTLVMLVPAAALVLVARKARLTVALFYVIGRHACLRGRGRPATGMSS